MDCLCIVTTKLCELTQARRQTDRQSDTGSQAFLSLPLHLPINQSDQWDEPHHVKMVEEVLHEVLEDVLDEEVSGIELCLSTQQKYRYQDDETPPADPSPGHMIHGRSTELSHTHLDGYTHPAALTDWLVARSPPLWTAGGWQGGAVGCPSCRRLEPEGLSGSC
ncbi:unnamed protein product [Pleuronectes platessa]|uniref:Uncharacterized protein n=1 Tax=Pleuronectes platessa TaxID=8262 RepID=A0A9N7U1Z1_PLEPL|nr:unnamed protein product [Pleuronectes platessa]